MAKAVFGILRNLLSLLDSLPIIVIEDRKTEKLNSITENGQTAQRFTLLTPSAEIKDGNSNRSVCFHVSQSVFELIVNTLDEALQK